MVNLLDLTLQLKNPSMSNAPLFRITPKPQIKLRTEDKPPIEDEKGSQEPINPSHKVTWILSHFFSSNRMDPLHAM